MTMPPNRNPNDAAREQLPADRTARLDDLLTDRAIFGLDPADQAELDSLLGDSSDWPSDEEQIAAQAFLDSLEGEQLGKDLSASLRSRLLADASQFDFKASAKPPVAVAPAPVVTESAGSGRAFVWLLATAASLLIGLAVGSEWSRVADTSPSAIALQLESLRSSEGVTTVAWSATEDKAAVGSDGDRTAFDWGEVVWSDAENRGFMIINGLAVNDPTVEQYQLWVFDAERNADYPVDGGVFDIPGDSGELTAQAIVPIRVKLPVTQATLFAITVEKPGGVVVSDRSRLPLLAQR